MNDETSLTPQAESQIVEAAGVPPIMDIETATDVFKQLNDFVSKIMKAGVDYGKVPGTDKDCLLKPGAEKLKRFFGLSQTIELLQSVEDRTGYQHDGEPFFSYDYRCQIWKGKPREGGLLIAEWDGSCNSWESKYRYRWVPEHDIPARLKSDKDSLDMRMSTLSEYEFAVTEAKTSGKYSKPAEYWQKFRQAISSGKARKVERQTRSGATKPAWVVEDVFYRIPNEDVHSQVNTIRKMAIKRAFVGAMIAATNSSEYFTQDMEDQVASDVQPPAENAKPAAEPDAATDGQAFNQLSNKVRYIVDDKDLTDFGAEVKSQKKDMTVEQYKELVAMGTEARKQIKAQTRRQQIVDALAKQYGTDEAKQALEREGVTELEKATSKQLSAAGQYLASRTAEPW